MKALPVHDGPVHRLLPGVIEGGRLTRTSPGSPDPFNPRTSAPGAGEAQAARSVASSPRKQATMAGSHCGPTFSARISQARATGIAWRYGLVVVMSTEAATTEM